MAMRDWIHRYPQVAALLQQAGGTLEGVSAEDATAPDAGRPHGPTGEPARSPTAEARGRWFVHCVVRPDASFHWRTERPGAADGTAPCACGALQLPWR